MVSELDTEQCASEDAVSPGEWIVRSHIGWRGKRNIPYKSVKTSPREDAFLKTEGKPERESPKRTISTSGGLRLFQVLCLFYFKQFNATRVK